MADKYPKLVHTKFREYTFNPWDAANVNHPRNYSTVNKPGGPGVHGNRPKVVNRYKCQTQLAVKIINDLIKTFGAH